MFSNIYLFSKKTGFLLLKSSIFILGERLYPMILEETPQGVPDRGLVVYVEPLLYEMVQGLYVRPSQGYAETFLIVGQFTFHQS